MENIRSLYLQCTTGISGDMLLGGLADLGVDFTPLEQVFRTLDRDFSLRIDRKKRGGFAGTQCSPRCSGRISCPALDAMLEALHALELPSPVLEQSEKALHRLAEVEAKVHGVEKDRVHFHETGTLDTLVDITGAFWGMDQMNVSEIHCSDLPWFQGTVKTAHGTIPLPAPATVELLKGKPVVPALFTREMITPTGALLVDQLVNNFTGGPEGTVLDSGMGWGTMELEDMPNGLRVFLVEKPGLQEWVWVLETNVDHLTGEEIGDGIERIMEAGALDVIYLPGVMKKNRPGGVLQVLSDDNRHTTVEEVLFAVTLSLGIRRRKTERVVLSRGEGKWRTGVGDVKTKEFDVGSARLSRPEFEEIKQVAEKTGLTPAQIRMLLMEGKFPGRK